MAVLATDKSKSPVVKFEYPCPEAAYCPNFTNFILFIAAFGASVF
jgi:hypothetical protein